MRGKFRNAAWAYPLIVTLAACGGGGGGGSPALTPTRTHTTSVATLTPTVPPSPATPALTSTPEISPTIAPHTPTEPPPVTDTPEPTATPEPSETPTPTEEPTSTFTPTETPLTGPLVTAFGLAEGTGTFNNPIATDGSGRPVYQRPGGDNFILYVEGRPGFSGLPVATNLLSTLPNDPAGQPDLQIVSSRALGDGSAEVCDRSHPNAGGIPAVSPPDFSRSQPVSDALNDFACRFRVFTEVDFACTQDNNATLTFRNGGSVVQFCTLVNDSFEFPAGDTVLTARLRDTAGRAGPAMEIVVRVTP